MEKNNFRIYTIYKKLSCVSRHKDNLRFGGGNANGDLREI